MAKMKVKLEKLILDFVERFYKKDAEIIEKTGRFLETAEYGRLVSLMEEVDQNHRRNVGVLHSCGRSEKADSDQPQKESLEACNILGNWHCLMFI